MAISTYKVFLMHKKDSAYEKLIDITSFPDMGGQPEMLQTTSLSNKTHTYIPGVQDLGDGLQFEANYSKDDYVKLKALENVEHDYAVWFGGTEAEGVLTPTGADGKFEFSGKMVAFPSGGGVNEVVSLSITIAPSTDIVFKAK